MIGGVQRLPRLYTNTLLAAIFRLAERSTVWVLAHGVPAKVGAREGMTSEGTLWRSVLSYCVCLVSVSCLACRLSFQHAMYSSSVCSQHTYSNATPSTPHPRFSLFSQLLIDFSQSFAGAFDASLKDMARAESSTTLSGLCKGVLFLVAIFVVLVACMGPKELWKP